MVTKTPNPNPNAFIRTMRKIYNPIGFKKGYNFILFFIFAGALLGFSLARASYMNVNANFLPGAAPGEAYWYRSKKLYNIGIHIHLICIIPAGILAVVQFIPIVRYKVLLLHRINGYVVVLLLLVGNVGALMIVRRAFGGTLATQAGVGILAISTTVSAILAYVNIKRLQIEQHRAWMLRCWFYAGSIITLRIIMIISVAIISKIGSYYIAMPCEQITGSGGNAERYAACREDPTGYTAVHANFQNPMGIEEVAAPFELSFGMALWLALLMHAVGVEIYLHLTKAETERLRQVSYERQLERGMRHPGSAGLTSDRLGDCKRWSPSVVAGGEGLRSDPSLASKQDAHDPVVRSDSESEVSKPARALGWN